MIRKLFLCCFYSFLLMSVEVPHELKTLYLYYLIRNSGYPSSGQIIYNFSFLCIDMHFFQAYNPPITIEEDVP